MPSTDSRHDLDLDLLRHLAVLRERIAAPVHAPGEPGYDAARATFNVTIDQRPAAIVEARSAVDVAATVKVAAERGLRVAPQGTSHNAGPLGDLSDTVLLRTGAMDEVTIDAERRIARVGAGARWGDVTGRAAAHGLYALHGSSPTVGVLGYSLGGGMGWLARKHGLQVNQITAAEVVLADGRLVRADAETHADVFWGVRGGGANVGIVTALEFRLLPLTEIHAGALFFPIERAPEVLHRWLELTETAPEEITSVGRVLQFPPFDEVPEPLRGKAFAIVEAAMLLPEEEAAAWLAPLRELEPEMDTFATGPTTMLERLHMDPEDPVPALSTHALLDAGLGAEGLDALFEVARPGMPLVGVELRHTGGALARAPEGAGAVGSLPGGYALFAVGVPTPETAGAVAGALARLQEVVAPWDAGRYGNFTEEPADFATLTSDAVAARMRSLRAELDPRGVLRANHPA